MTSFNGTSLSAEHIGEVPSRELGLVRAQITPGAEVANAIPFALQLKDLNGENVQEAVALRCTVRDLNGAVAAAGAFTADETGAGTLDSVAAQPVIYITTDAQGQAEVTVSDVVTTSTAKVYLEVEPINRAGAVTRAEATFA